jgi:predicted nucleic acid-binding protein
LAVVVSDTSPVRALAHLGRLELLHALFDSVIVPPAVAAELRSPPAGLPGVEILAFDFMSVQAPCDSVRVAELLLTLDAGESEALVLAVELGIPAILMDDAAGRAMARHLGLLPIGVLGALVRAKQRGLIESVGPLMDRLQSEIDFFMSDSLRAEILRMAGESGEAE